MSTSHFSAGDADDVRSTIETWTSQMGHDWPAWLAHYTPDGVLMAPGSPRIVGRTAIEAYVQEGFGDVANVRHTHWSIEGDGDLAVVNNDIEFDGADGSTTIKQIIVLVRRDGVWRVQQVCFNGPGG